jgi:anti-sigma-K factor RskA
LKALLPAYLEHGLDRTEQGKVEQHLASCADCSEELSLLRMMAEDPVPDPGEAFWAALPERIHRAVREQEENRKKSSFDLAGLWNRLTLTRWVAAAATVGIVLMISWYVIREPQEGPGEILSQEYDIADQVIAADSADIVSLNELANEELEIMEGWAGSQLASLSPEIEQALVESAGDTDIYEELIDRGRKSSS